MFGSMVGRLVLLVVASVRGGVETRNLAGKVKSWREGTDTMAKFWREVRLPPHAAHYRHAKVISRTNMNLLNHAMNIRIDENLHLPTPTQRINHGRGLADFARRWVLPSVGGFAGRSDEFRHRRR